MGVLWFFVGLIVGLALDFVLVLHMLKPLKKRILELENRRVQKECRNTPSVITNLSNLTYMNVLDL